MFQSLSRPAEWRADEAARLAVERLAERRGEAGDGDRRPPRRARRPRAARAPAAAIPASARAGARSAEQGLDHRVGVRVTARSTGASAKWSLLQPLWRCASAEIEITRAATGSPPNACASVPPRSTQSSASDDVGAAQQLGAIGPGRNVPGREGCRRWSVGKAAATFRSVRTPASRRSASSIRSAQAHSARLTRPARISGRSAPARSCAIASRLAASAPAGAGGRWRARSGNDGGEVERRLLHRGVEADVGRCARVAARERVRPHERLERRRHGCRLVVPLDVAADQRTLVGGRVDPVDPRPPPRRVDGPGRAEHEHRHAVAEGVEQRHRRVHQADVGVERDSHRPLGHLRVAVGDRDGVLLVQRDHHLRLLVAEIVDEAVVEAPIARARVEAQVRQLEPVEHLRQRIRAPRDLAALRRRDGRALDGRIST